MCSDMKQLCTICLLLLCTDVVQVWWCEGVVQMWWCEGLCRCAGMEVLKVCKCEEHSHGG